MTTRFTDHFKGPDTHANRPAANAVPVGAVYVCTDHKLIYKSDGATWNTWADLNGAATAGLKRTHIRRAGGDFTLAPTTAWTAIDTTIDLTIAAKAGDVIEFEPNFLYNITAAIETNFDVAIVKAGTVVRNFGGAAAGSYGGLGGWAKFVTGLQPVVGAAPCTVQSGDLDTSGNITLRMVYRNSNTNARTLTLYSGSYYNFTVTARNLG